MFYSKAKEVVLSAEEIQKYQETPYAPEPMLDRRSDAPLKLTSVGKLHLFLVPGMALLGASIITFVLLFELKNESPVVKAFVFLLELLFLTGAIFFPRRIAERQKNLIRFGESTKGLVTSVELKRTKNSTYDLVKVIFEAKNSMHELKSSTKPGKYQKGQTISTLYDSINPQNATLFPTEYYELAPK